ncbi:MAG: Glycosyl transferase group 1 [candidate division WWE3 bacterium GW2011_GWA1_46_21]|uniref:Glycosyl transferase group 1 n=4 Tax=Katanobacteria TaxID=422282 RepID=A0A0G1PD87_UNCKA|nr:MAG: Glycosyl transferase group 1 [candidate division WWE3 bacterium GW2011_GWA1_46_21]KKU49400.1 MAG: Glycosyl transferase group 1 [candidate division WWE3 bacterium GW2011_GWA2_46_9]KKU51028.1 MAG: Glycosyl transferase group 1 [candidate division WWE3 bacterium GW2011_GWC1_47_10]KKU58005.1 MAG: Glycosyl transferase group 1 [candidate division WWE3 bacterium GW2011_GWB1_47_11]
MKILMWARSDLYDYIGGDRVQIENTANALRVLGVDVDIATDINIDIETYDLVHVFQLDWTPETYFYVQKARKHNKPVILSPIHHSLKEVHRFDNEYVFDYRRITKYLFREQHNRDTFKNIYRSLFNIKKARPTFLSLLIGLAAMHKRTLQSANVVLVQTEIEAKDLKETYNVDFEWEKVLNGVSRSFVDVPLVPSPIGVENYIISVGRVEPRKNTLKIIDAVADFRKKHNLDVKLVLVGKKSRNHIEYLIRFGFAVRRHSWIVHIEELENAKMPPLYQHAKVCVSASWFETTGLTLLEALFCGTNAVASGDRAKEYLGAYASYCDPGSVASIESAVEKEFFSARPKLPIEMKKTYTWENTASKIKGIYMKELVYAD